VVRVATLNGNEERDAETHRGKRNGASSRRLLQDSSGGKGPEGFGGVGSTNESERAKENGVSSRRLLQGSDGDSGGEGLGCARSR
jgi:hypothetical protein